MRKFENLSIKTIFTLIFVAIFATLLALLFFINKFMLQDYYQSQKMKQIGVAYSTIDKAIAVAEDSGQSIFELISNESEKTTQQSPTIAIFRTLNERSNIDVVMMNRDRTRAVGTSRDANWLAMKLNVYMNYLEITDTLPGAVRDEDYLSDNIFSGGQEMSGEDTGINAGSQGLSETPPDNVYGRSQLDISGFAGSTTGYGSGTGEGNGTGTGSAGSGTGSSTGSVYSGTGSAGVATGTGGGTGSAGGGTGTSDGVDGTESGTADGAGDTSGKVKSSGSFTFSANISDINDQVKVLERTDNYFIQLVVDARTNTSHLECMGVFSDNDTFFLMTVPIESIEEGVGITTKFLFISGLIMLGIGSVVVYYAVGKCTAPINSLARLSDKIANLDFSERYEGKSLNELGVLGNSMNSMSEKLEASIRELSAANEKLQADIEEKIRMDEARKEFIADVSHELKTPIALIEGYAEGLVEGLAEDKDTRDYYCNVIIDEAVKMNKMVKQLTSLISYEFGGNAPERQDFNICDLIRSVTDSMKLRFAEKEAVLTLDLPEEVMVCADEFKIEEVFTNYLNNAFNHLNGDRNIVIRLIRGEDGSVTVTVYNDGIPIPEESIDRVWDKFYKVDKARTRAYGGSGIGLSIVKAIMESHGGRYGVTNHDKGVEFFFTLV